MNTRERMRQFDLMMDHIVSVQMREWLIDRGFFTAPASTKYHGAYEGGLFDHSCQVAKSLMELTDKLELDWKVARSPFLIGMFHDICKIDQYRHPIVGYEHELGTGLERPVYDTGAWEYNPDTFFKGHGDKSVILLSQFFTLTEEEIFCIRYHMGAFSEKDEWNLYSKAVNKYPNVLYTHTADMIASQVLGI